ncbi:MAG: M48 family metallopeptidase [Chrysiogenetes bacterium]|nr:M48 family metallopeptidase [Chrysiogenetes bacterium]
MATASRAIEFGNTRIYYRLRRGKRQKTVGIAIDPVQGVLVRAPHGLPVVEVDRIVRRKARWIVSRMDRSAGVPVAQAAREFVSGESFSYLGRNYRLKVIRSRRSETSVKLVGGRFLVEVGKGIPKRRQAEEIRGALVDWYRAHALDKLRSRVHLLAPKLGLEPPEVLIRDQRRRWASCDSRGCLRFNWRIAMAPLSLVDYVVAHELCHLVYHDHSVRFWRALRQLLPDFETRKERLALEGPRFIL